MALQISSNMEDYLESIFVLGKERGSVRVKDIAARMQISLASVSGAVKNLEQQGLVSHPRYDRISLTASGVEIAEEVYERHRVIHLFLTDVLGLDDSIAERDACRIEHNISSETFEGLKRLISKHS